MMNEKYLDCTPEYADFLCFEILEAYNSKVKLSKIETFRRDKLTYECMIRNNATDVPFHKVGDKGIALKANSLVYILNYLTFDKTKNNIEEIKKYLPEARKIMRNYDEAIDKKLITKESLGLTIKHYHQPSRMLRHTHKVVAKIYLNPKKKIKY